jgi:hypothetical protein
VEFNSRSSLRSVAGIAQPSGWQHRDIVPALPANHSPHRRLTAAIAAACMGTCGELPAASDCPPPAEQAAGPAEQYQKLSREFNTVAYAWRQAATDAERQALFARIEGIPMQLLDLARSHPQDPVALDALAQVVAQEYWFTAYTAHPGWGKDSPQAAAIAILLRDYLTSDKIGEACKRVQYGFRQECEDFLRTVLEKNPHREIQGMACLRLAEFLATRIERLELLKDQPEMARRYELIFGKEYLGKLHARGRAAAMSEAEALYVQAGEKFGEVKNPDGGTVGERVEKVLYEMRHLAIGKEAPDISGRDQDGQAFKLSDYRGKVVLIYFWSEY